MAEESAGFAVSVIVPFHNYGRYIRDCLESIWADPRHILECIVVDDGSDAEEAKEAKTWCDVHPKTLLVPMGRNCGVSCARNTGIRASKGNLIVCLDADDMLVPGGIHARVMAFSANPKLDMVYGHAYKLNEARANSEWTYEACAADFKSLEVYGRWLNAQTVMWRRSVFDRFGLYFEGLRSKEDKEMIVRLGIHPDFQQLKRLIRSHKVADKVAIYRRHDGAKHRRRLNDKKWFAETERVFDMRIKELRREGITKENTPWL